jgi:hypothetical protein
MNSFFQDLGRTILEQWKKDNFSLDTFPALATAALTQHPPASRVPLSEVIGDFLLTDDQPPQTDSDFGEPELVVYSNPRFYIQLLFWMDGTTAIHQHEFSGAFHVMHGSSIHAHYDFDKPKSVTPYLRVGNVKLREIELLETGRTVPITSGPRTIHSLFHLDSPSVTVVVRTQHDPGTGPQFNYMPPHVAFDPIFSDKLTMRRKQLLSVLEQTEDPGYADVCMAMIADLDFERGFSVLHHARAYLQHLDPREPVLRAFERKHGPLATGIAATLNEDARRSQIRDLRSSVTDPEHRFFLALLMNAPTRADLLALVRQRFPKDKPADVVTRWVEELTETSEEGTSTLDAVFPENINVPPDRQPPLFAAAFRHFLAPTKSLPPALRALTPTHLKSLRAAFATSALAVITA